MEIWCEAPLEIARGRFEERHPRHAIHGELLTDAEWERWRVTAQPLRIGPALRIDTTGPVDVNAIITWINQRAPADPQEPTADAMGLSGA